ncbi:hypothetical protein F4819DRAFT_491322 [Hypoxylon fuscum]|nr:hypothetical protein F4819DRAFT_491322 [Hypoxylon fuscum]
MGNPVRDVRDDESFIRSLCCVLTRKREGCSTSPSKKNDESDKPSEQQRTTVQSPSGRAFVPRHARESFMKTATPRQMKKANEILDDEGNKIPEIADADDDDWVLIGLGS